MKGYLNSLDWTVGVFLNKVGNHCSELNTAATDQSLETQKLCSCFLLRSIITKQILVSVIYVHTDRLIEADMFTTWSCERQSTRGSCICTLCHFGQVCVCVYSNEVKGHCVGGHQTLCEGCCFEAG